MKDFKGFKCLLLLVLVTSCGVAVRYDYEKSTDFSQYKTYNYFDDMKSGLSELDTRRLLKAMDERLLELGLKRTDNADFYIDIQSRNLQNGSNSSVGLGVGGTGNQVGGGVSVGIPLGQGNQVREIFIEFVDLKKDQMFWQAISSDSFNQTATPEIREANFIAIVDKIFQKYPPGD